MAVKKLGTRRGNVTVTGEKRLEVIINITGMRSPRNKCRIHIKCEIIAFSHSVHIYFTAIGESTD